jgi:hypothetical protein
MPHVHDPQPFLIDAIGVYSKRGDKADELGFDGWVDRCKCGKGWFIPYDKKLRTVEIETLPLPE